MSSTRRFELLESRYLLAGLEIGDFGNLVSSGDSLYFWHVTAETGRELYRSTQQSPAKSLVHDIVPGPDGAWVDRIHTIGDRVVFLAEKGTSFLQLRARDGTEAGLRLLREVASTEQRPRSIETLQSSTA